MLCSHCHVRSCSTKHILSTLSQGAFDVKSAIAAEFYRCKSKDTAPREGYKAAVGRAAKQQFRAQWAREQYKVVIKQTTESVSHITDATYVTFGQLVVQYGRRSPTFPRRSPWKTTSEASGQSSTEHLGAQRRPGRIDDSSTPVAK